jgi:hypothetical protein
VIYETLGRWYSAASVSKRLTDETAAQPIARGAVPIRGASGAEEGIP